MNNIWVVVGLIIMLLGAGGVIYGIYLSFAFPHMAILGIWSRSLELIVLGFIVWLIGWRNTREERLRSPPE